MATRSLQIDIVGDPSSFSRAMRRVSKDADDASKRFGFLSRTAGETSEVFSGFSLRVAGVGGSMGKLLPVVAAATPALVALGGAATAVAGSMSAAAAGAGALGTGLAASLAPVLVVGKQVTSRFEAIKEAYEAVKTAQKEGTDAARKNAQQALAQLSGAERAAVDSFQRVAHLQTQVLGGASDRIFRALAGAIDRIAPVVEGLTRPFNRLGAAIADVITKASRSLTGPAWTGALRAFVNAATDLVGPFSRIFGSIANIMRDVALAALPLVKDAVRGVADSFGNLDAQATRGKIREVVRDLVDHTRSWWRLTREVGELIFRVFNGGADAGQSLVDSLTKIVNRWNRFLATREGQQEMRRFFRDAVKLTKDLAVILGALAAAIFKVSNLIIRVTNGLQGFEAWVGKADAALNRWVSGALRDVRAALARLPTLVKRLGPLVFNAAVTVGKAIGEGILAGAKSALTGGDDGGLKDQILDNLPGLGPARRLGKIIGDGVGKKVLPPLPAGGPGGLMGADPDLAPFAAIGQRFGLRVTDGIRAPGTRTSSGGISLHSTGDAIDMSGPASGMMRFARTMASRFGSRLSELIYSPMGFSIKDGKRTAPYAVADHYDHVHLAYEGPFGDGPGRSAALQTVADAAKRAGILPKILYGVWGAESNFSMGPGPTSPAGAQGPFQFMPATAQSMGVNPGNFNSAAYGAARYLAQYKSRGVAGMLAAYNAGPAGNPNNPETRAYIPKVLAVAARWPGVDGRSSRGGASGASGGGGGAAGNFREAQKEGRGAARQAVGAAREAAGEERAAGRELPAARLGVRRAKAEARDDLSGLIKVMVDERKAKRRRLRAIRKVLKRRINKKRRVRLLNEEAELIAEIGDLNESIKEYKADQAGGATTITRAEELEAGVDPNAGDAAAGGGGDAGGGAAAPDPALEEHNRLLAEQNALLAEQAANQKQILQLARQGPAILASVVAAVNGGIGGKTGLGFQSVGYAPGTVAAY